MTKASDNQFPKVIMEEVASDGSATGNPAADHRALFLGEDGALHLRDSAGNITDVGGASTTMATDTIWDAKGDLVGGTGANTAARLAVAANGSSLRAASGATTGLEWQLNNLAASAAPTVNDDSGDGYSVGSRWIDTTADKEYVCLDASVGAAVWTETTQAGGASQSLPADVPDLAIWLAADAITGLSDGNEVVTWRNGITSQPSFDAVPVGNPTYQTNELNSLPIVRFDGSDYFQLFCPAVESPGLSIFLVFKMAAITNAYSGVVGFGKRDPSSPFIVDGGGFFIKSNGKSAVYIGAGTSYDGTGAITYGTTNWNYTSLIFGPTTYSTRRNGSADVSGTAWNWGVLVTPYVYLGNQAVASRFMSGDIAEVLIYGRAVTTTERDAIESYLATKYGL